MTFTPKEWRPEHALAYSGLSGSALFRARVGTWLGRMYCGWRKETRLRSRSLWSVLYGTVREVGSLAWRIRVLRERTWYWNREMRVPQLQPQSKILDRHRIEQRARIADTLTLLSKYPQATALDVHLFHLGWDRRSQSQDAIAAAELGVGRSTSRNGDLGTQHTVRTASSAVSENALQFTQRHLSLEELVP